MKKETTKDETVYYKISESELETLKEMTMGARNSIIKIKASSEITDEDLQRVISSLGLVLKAIDHEVKA